jgi:cytochrome c5
MMTSKYWLFAVFILASVSVLALAAQKSDTPITPPITKTFVAAKHRPEQEDEGQRIFQQNCSRCHASPEGFSPRISGTILRHMRVRASLSQHDEEALLRFFNP